jgi:ferredoxin
MSTRPKPPRQEDNKPPPDKKPPPDESDSSSDDETPTTRPTRQAYQSFNGTRRHEQTMLLLALRGELNSKEPKFIKQTLQQNTKNRFLKTLQDEDIEFEKLVVLASKAFSLTWVKQIALGKLLYKPTFLTKYTAHFAQPKVTKKQPAKIKQTLKKPPPAAIDIVPRIVPRAPAEIKPTSQSDLPDPHTLPSRPFEHHIWEGHRSDRRMVRNQDSPSEHSEDLLTPSVDEANVVETTNTAPMLTRTLATEQPAAPSPHQDSDISTIAPSPQATEKRAPPIHHQDSDSSTTAQWKRDIENKIEQTLRTETTTTWKEELETTLKATLNSSINLMKEELLETLSTTKGELLSHLDVLRADMSSYEQDIEDKTKKAEAVYDKLQLQQQTMEDLQRTMQQHMQTAQTFANSFHQNAIKERIDLQAERETQRTSFKWDMEQASRQHLAKQEEKCDTAMNQSRIKQTVDFRHSCKTLHKEYKQRIVEKYENLESEAMQIADQAALDLSDILNQVLQQEKTTILQAITPEKILLSITDDIKTTLDTSTAKHMDSIKEQRKTVITQLQKTAKRTNEQIEQQRREIRTDIKNGKGTLQATATHEMTKLQEDIAKLRPSIEQQEKDTMAASFDDIKSKASIAFSLELQSKVQTQVRDFTALLKTKSEVHESMYARKNPETTPDHKSHATPQSTQWTDQSPTHPIPATPDRPMANRFKLASSKGLEDKLPKFRRDDLYVHLPPDPAQHYMEAFYETLATTMQNFDYPIITLQNLTPRGSTCPESAYDLYEHDTIKKIGRALYQKLLGVIPSTCTTLHNLLANHSATQDGYRALYAMMRLKCPYLQDLLPTWGPTWPKGTTAFEYVSTLQSYLTQDRRRNKIYTEFEIAAEMVQQAKRHPEYQLLAGAYMAQLISLPTDTTNMSPEFLHENLALNFESNRQSSAPTNPSINKFGQRGGGSSDRKPGEQRRHQYKNPVQCGSCRLFGHCINSQVCRFSAQFMYAKEYVEKHPEKAKANADAYNAANNKTTVNKIYLQFPEKFHDDMTEQEEENLRYEMATTFYSQGNEFDKPAPDL